MQCLVVKRSLARAKVLLTTEHFSCVQGTYNPTNFVFPLYVLI